MPCRASISLALACALALSAGCVPDSPADTGEDTSCGGTDTGEIAYTSLIDHSLWQVVDAADDPLADHRPDVVDCGIAGWYVENLGLDNERLEIDTNSCNYLALSQPTLIDLEQGQRVEVSMFYFDLVVPEPAVGHIALLVGGEILWELEVDIPGDAAVHMEAFESPISAPAGTPVVFHLHNHGQNTWVLQGLGVETCS